MADNPSDELRDDQVPAPMESEAPAAPPAAEPETSAAVPNFFSPTYDSIVKDGTVDDMSWSAQLDRDTERLEQATKAGETGLFGNWQRGTVEETKAEIAGRKADLAERKATANLPATQYLDTQFSGINRRGAAMIPGYTDEAFAGALRKDELAEIAKEQRLIDAAEFNPDYRSTGRLRSFIENTAQGTANIAAGVVEGIGLGAGFAGSAIDHIAGSEITGITSQDNSVAAVGRWLKARSKAIFPGDPLRQEDFESKLAQGIGSLAGFYGVNAAAIAARLSTPMRMYLVGAVGALATSADTHGDAVNSIKEGRDVSDTQRLLAYVGGLVIGASEAAPILNNIPGLSVKTKKAAIAYMAAIGREGIEEALQEGFQSFGQNLIANNQAFGHDPERSLWDGVGEGMLIGFLTGGGAQALRLASRSGRARARQEAGEAAPTGTDPGMRAPGDAPGAGATPPPEPVERPNPRTMEFDLDQYADPSFPDPQQVPEFQEGQELSGSARPVWPLSGPGSVAPTPPVPTFNDILDALHQSGQLDENGEPDAVGFQDSLEALTGKRFFNQLTDAEKSAALQVALGADLPAMQPDTVGSQNAPNAQADSALAASGKPVNQPDTSAGTQAGSLPAQGRSTGSPQGGIVQSGAIDPRVEQVRRERTQAEGMAAFERISDAIVEDADGNMVLRGLPSFADVELARAALEQDIAAKRQQMAEVESELAALPSGRRMTTKQANLIAELSEFRQAISEAEGQLQALTAASEQIRANQMDLFDPALAHANQLHSANVPAAEWPTPALIAGQNAGLIRLDNQGAPRLAPTPADEMPAASDVTPDELAIPAAGTVRGGRLGKRVAEGDPAGMRMLVESLNRLTDKQIKSRYGKIARLAKARNRAQLLARSAQGIIARELRRTEDAELSNTARDLIEQTVEDVLTGDPITETVTKVQTEQVVNTAIDEVTKVTKHLDTQMQLVATLREAGVDSLTERLQAIDNFEQLLAIARFNSIAVPKEIRESNSVDQLVKRLVEGTEKRLAGITAGAGQSLQRREQAIVDAIADQIPFEQVTRSAGITTIVAGFGRPNPSSVRAPEKTVEEIVEETAPRALTRDEFVQQLIAWPEGEGDRGPDVSLPDGRVFRIELKAGSYVFSVLEQGVRFTKGPAGPRGVNVWGRRQAALEAADDAGLYDPPASEFTTEEERTPLDQIVNPIRVDGTEEEKLAEIAALTAENIPILERIIAEIDAVTGAKSKSNAKLPAAIAAKAKRPSILAKKPWHGMEHIRDTLRFKTVISRLDQVPQAFEVLMRSGVKVVKIDTPKLFEPKEWGWRIVAFDLRMPNGQLIEWYLPIEELETAKKVEGHHLFEIWRNEDPAKLSAEQKKAYLFDLNKSRALYDNALQTALTRMGYADEAAARASWTRLSASLPEIAAKFSAMSSAEGSGASGDIASNQSPAASRTNPPVPSGPASDGSTTSARPSSLSSQTEGLSIESTSIPNIGSEGRSSNEEGVEITPEAIVDSQIAGYGKPVSDIARKHAVALERIGTDSKLFYDLRKKLSKLLKSDLHAVGWLYGKARPADTKAKAIDAIAAEFARRTELEAEAATIAGDVGIITRDQEDHANDRRRADRDRRVREVARTLPDGVVPESTRPDDEGRDAGGAPAGDRGGSGGPVRADEAGSGTPSAGAGDGLRAEGEGAESGEAGRQRDGDGGDYSSADVVAAAEQAEKERKARRRQNYRITDDDAIGAGGPKGKVRANIEAIRIVKRLDEEKRPATAEEKRALVKYTGWGAFAQELFQDYKREWEPERRQLQDLLTEDEYAAARKSVLNAHYTSKDVIDGMWGAVQHLGFSGGRALEPSSGVGHFIGLIPQKLASKTDWTAVELDTITGKIAAALYRGTDVRISGFQDVNFPDNYFDLAISNVPFDSSTKLPYKGRLSLLLHDYFFARSLDKVRPGGLVAFITSSGTLDKKNRAARRMIASKADFVGAIRLPGGDDGAFAGNAGTEVTTDIVFLRKRIDGEQENHQGNWLDVDEIQTPEGPTLINRYYIDNPSMMLGEMRLIGEMYRDKSPVLIGSPENLGARIIEAAKRMPKNVFTDRQTTNEDIGKEPELSAPGTKEGSFFTKKGKIYQNQLGAAVHQDIEGKVLKRIRGLMAIRDVTNEILVAQMRRDTASTPELRAKLNEAYDAFVKDFGPINREVATVRKTKQKDGTVTESISIRRPNWQLFEDDPDAPKVFAIENYDPESGKASKTSIFTSDVISSYQRPQVSGPTDALAVSLNETGGVDMRVIGEILGVSEAEAAAALGDRVFRNPNRDRYETAEIYLSGDVVAKLDQAREAAKTNAELQRNVAALEAVQPPPLTRVDIRVKLGAPWVPAEVYNEFIAKVIGINETVKFEPVSSQWVWSKPGRPSEPPSAQSAYGTNRSHVSDLVIAALNSKAEKVWDKDPDTEKRVLNVEATEQAAIKVKLIREAFAGDPNAGLPGWIWEDEDRAQKLEAVYNRSFNRLVGTKFDGAHLQLPGLSETLTLPNGKVVPLDRMPHRVNAVWRIIQQGNTLIDHAVGAGKAQPLDAKVLTPSGWRRMGDLQVGDFVIAGDGTPTRVTGVYPQGEKDIFRVTFSDGASTECCDEHLWLTQTYKERNYASKAKLSGKDWECAGPKVRPLSEIRETLVAGHLGAKNHSIPMVGPVAFNAEPLPLDPYVLGVLIGDGCLRTKAIMFSSADAEIVEAVKSRLPAECEVRHHAAYDYRISYTGERAYRVRTEQNGFRGIGVSAEVSHPVGKALRQLGLWGKYAFEKRIPEHYLLNSIEARVMLLRGLMDTDGYVSSNGTSVEFSTTSPGLADDVTALVQSLGGVARRREKEIVGHRRAYTLAIAMPADINPFMLTRKASRVVPKSKYRPIRYVEEVVSVGRKLAQCISVEHPTHLYVTDDFIVTHNTITMIAAAMEQKRLGLVQRPMFVVPNHMLEQFSREFLQAYPNAKILVASKKNMEAKNRKRFAAKIAAEKWDGIIIKHSDFGRLGMKPEAVKEYLDAQMDEIMAAWLEAKREAGEKDNGKPSRDPTVKNIERKKNAVAAKLEKLAAKERKDDGVTFEETGVDYLVVDEAHIFKNLDYQSSHQNVKGIGVKGSQRAEDLFMKIRHLEKSRPGRSALFATGTPMSRSMAEIYTMQRYLQNDLLVEYGVDKFDTWAATFGEIVTNTEIAPDGRSLKETTSFSKFVNVAELNTIYSQVADSVTSNDLQFPRPALKGGKVQVVDAELSPAEESEVQRIIKDIAALKVAKGPPKKGAPNHLSLLTKGLQASMDLRLLYPDAPYNPKGKIARLVNNVAEIYKAGEKPALAQIIFLDMGVPGSKPRKKKEDAVDEWDDTTPIQKIRAKIADEDVDENLEEEVDAEEAAQTREREGKFDLYADIIERLVAQGIPRGEIATIYDAKNDQQKAALFKQVREGKIRVLLGSSQKMGVGTNVQRYLIAMHHVDAPWNPADVVQRDGRIIRQGNENKEVSVFRYITKRSFESYRWQLLDRKSKFEAQFRAGARGLREAEDIDAPLPEAAELKAAASGDPRIIEHAELTKELRELDAAKRGHERSYIAAQRAKTETVAQIANIEKYLAKYREDAAKVKETKGDKFRIRLDVPGAQGEVRERKEAGERIRNHVLSAVQRHWGRDTIDMELGSLSGFVVVAQGRRTDQGYTARLSLQGAALYLPAEGGYKIISAESDPVGMVRTLENILSNIPGLVSTAESQIEQKQKDLVRLEKQAEPKPFPRALRLAEVKARLEALEAEFKAAKEAPAAPEQAPAEGWQTDPNAPPVSIPEFVDSVATLKRNLQAGKIAGPQTGPSREADDIEEVSSLVPDGGYTSVLARVDAEALDPSKVFDGERTQLIARQIAGWKSEADQILEVVEKHKGISLEGAGEGDLEQLRSALADLMVMVDDNVQLAYQTNDEIGILRDNFQAAIDAEQDRVSQLISDVDDLKTIDVETYMEELAERLPEVSDEDSSDADGTSSDQLQIPEPTQFKSQNALDQIREWSGDLENEFAELKRAAAAIMQRPAEEVPDSEVEKVYYEQLGPILRDLANVEMTANTLYDSFYDVMTRADDALQAISEDIVYPTMQRLETGQTELEQLDDAAFDRLMDVIGGEPSDEMSAFVGNPQSEYQEDVRSARLRRALARELKNAEGRLSRAGIGADSQGGIAAAGAPEAQGAATGGARRDAIGEVLRDRRRLADALDAFLSEELRQEAVEERATSQGFVVDAYHGTLKAFDTPNAFRNGRDFGFHVSLNHPRAANSRLGQPSTIVEKLDSFFMWLFRGQKTQIREDSNIMPLRLRVSNPLRLADVAAVGEKWSDPVAILNLLEHPHSKAPEALRRWVKAWISANGADQPGRRETITWQHLFSREFATELTRLGYDAVIYRNMIEGYGYDSMFVWEPERVRSAFDYFHPDAAGAPGLRASDDYVEQDLAQRLEKMMIEEGLDDSQEAYGFDELSALAQLGLYSRLDQVLGELRPTDKVTAATLAQRGDGSSMSGWEETEEKAREKARRDADKFMKEGRRSPSDFVSGHFEESNIIGHMMTSMTSHQGRPVYTIDQIQSDWGQKLRDGGVKDDAKIAELKSRRAALEARRPDDSQLPKPDGANAAQISRMRDAIPGWKEWANERRLIDAELSTAEAATPGNPLVNTTDQWVTTTLRRAITQAVEANADYIAIPSGDTVLSYNPGDRNGMNEFYGKIVPKNLAKLIGTKGERIETLDSPSGKNGLGKGFTIFPITAELKARVLAEGLPMFALSGNLRPTPAVESVMPSIVADVEARLRKMLPPDIMVRFSADKLFSNEGHEQYGRFKPNLGLIDLTLRYGVDKAMQIGAHEIVHVLRRRNLFRDPEWKALVDRAKKLGIPAELDREGLTAKYRQALRNQARRLSLTPDQTDAMVERFIEEEYVARLAERYFSSPVENGQRKVSFGQQINDLLQRIADVLDAILDAYRGHGFNTADAVFRRMKRGVVAARKPAQPQTQPARPRRSVGERTAVRALWELSAFGGDLPADVKVQFTTNRIGQTNYQITANGEDIGRAYVRDLGDRVQVGNISIDEKWQRRGIGTALYAQIERDLGKPLVPDETLSDEAHSFWMKHRPEAVDGKYVKSGDFWTLDNMPRLSGRRSGNSSLLAQLAAIEKLAEMSAYVPEGRPFNMPGFDGRAYAFEKEDGFRTRTYRIERNGELVASVALSERDRESWSVIGMRIARGHQGKGLALRLMEAVEDDIGRPTSSDGIISAERYQQTRATTPDRVRFHVQGGKSFDGMYLSPAAVEAMREVAGEVLDAAGTDPVVAREMEKLRQIEGVIADQHFTAARTEADIAKGEVEELSALAGGSGGATPRHLPKMGDVTRSEIEAPDVRLSELVTMVIETLDMETRQGRLNPGLKAAMGRAGAKLYGQFSKRTGIARIAIPMDLPTLSHEGGHKMEIHPVLGPFVEGIKQAHAAELVPLASPGADQMSEGWAEWFRLFVLEPQAAQTRAPNVDRAFRNMMEANAKEMLTALEAIQQGYAAVVAASPAGAVLSRVQTTVRATTRIGRLRESIREKGWRGSIHDWLYAATTGAIDEKHPLRAARDFLLEEARRNLGSRVQQGQQLFLKAANDFYKLARMMEHARVHATATLRHGVRLRGQVLPTGPSMQDVLSEAFGGPDKTSWTEEKAQRFGAYLVARRMNAEWDRYDMGELENPPDHLLSRLVWSKAQRDFETSFPEFRRAARTLDKFMANHLEFKFQNGFITQDLYDDLRSRNGYAPLNRVMDDKSPSTTMKPSGQNKRALMFKFRGSTRDFINPLESIVADVYTTQSRVELNNVIRALDKVARAAGPNGGKIAERIPRTDTKVQELDLKPLAERLKIESEQIMQQAIQAGAIAQWDAGQLQDDLDALFDQNASMTLFSQVATNERGERIVYLWENGERIPILLGSDQMGEDIFEIFASVGRLQDLGPIFEGAVLMTSAFRAGVTKSPAYVVVNWFRDQLSTWALSRDFKPFWTGLTGLSDVVRGSDAAKMYEYFAGMMGGIDANIVDTMGRGRDVMQLRKSGFFAAPTTFQTVLRSMEITEAASRIGHMKAAYDRLVAEGFTEEEAAIEAAFNAHDVMDFSRHGSKMVHAARLVAFLNAQIQGLSAGLRTMRGERDNMVSVRDAVTPFLKATEGTPLSVGEKEALPNSTRIWFKLVAIGILGLALKLLYWDDPEHEELSKSQMGHTHWFFKIAGTWWRAPKPFELAVFSNLFEAMFDRFAKDDPTAPSRFIRAMRETVLLSPEMQVFPAITSIWGAVKGGLDTVSGKMQYDRSGGDLPMRLKGLPPELQWDAYTSEFSKLLANTLGISAYKADEFMRTLFANLGRDALTLSDFILPRVNIATGGALPGVAREVRADKSFEDYIFFSRITRRAPRGAESTFNFWQEMSMDNGRYVTAAGGYKRYLNELKSPRDARAFLARLDDDRKAYAILEGHHREAEQDLHPLNRAKQVIGTMNGIRRQMAEGNFFKETTTRRGREPERIALSPSKQKVVNEILEDMAMREARNAQIVLGKPGWKDRAEMPTDGLMAELRAAAPEVADELEWRMANGRNKVYSYQSVKELWPQVRRALLSEEPGSSLAAYRAQATVGR